MTNVACCGVEDDYDTEDAIADADKEAECNDQIKPNQISEIVLTNERWRCVKDALKRRQFPQIGRDTFSQIFTILSHVFSRVYSLAHTYVRHRHTHTRHRHKQDTDTKKRHRHKLSQSQKMKHTIKYCVCAFYFQ